MTDDEFVAIVAGGGSGLMIKDYCYLGPAHIHKYGTIKFLDPEHSAFVRACRYCADVIGYNIEREDGKVRAINIEGRGKKRVGVFVRPGDKTRQNSPLSTVE